MPRAPGLLGSWKCLESASTPTCYKISATHNRLLNSSMQLVTAVVKSAMMQILVKADFRQSELGMSATRLFLTW